MEHLSLDERRRPQQNNISLPSIDTFIETAVRGEDFRVARPGDHYAPQSAHTLHYGQLPQHGAGHPQTFSPYHASHGQLNNSIESVPSTAYPSPRTMANLNHSDTSSVSSSSRESSVYSGTPTSSNNTIRAGAASTSRSTRAKRGSESQGSTSGRARKRPSMSSNAGPRSEDDFIRWCDTCDSPWRDCRTPKEHERKSKKIVKEKASRERQAQVLQKLEDLLENNSDMTPLKLQMPGNQKKSGLLYDKQQVIEAVLIKADMDTRMLASLLGQDEFDRYCDRVSRAIREHVAANDNEGPLARSLLASVSGAEVPCAHVSRGLNCDTTIAYRKVRHTRNYNANLAMEFGTATATTTPTPAAATTLPVRSTRPGSTPRRRNDSSL